ncbi:MAG: ATP-binding cassette domain-containing protein, partial [Pararhizobium sp.]
MLLTLDDVSKSYRTAEGPLAVLQGIDLSLGAGESLALTGESGSGKSTLLHLVAGLDHPDGGRITVDGQAIGGLDDKGRAALRRSTVGLVFQQFNLIPSLTVAANLAFHARLAGRLDAG